MRGGVGEGLGDGSGSEAQTLRRLCGLEGSSDVMAEEVGREG